LLLRRSGIVEQVEPALIEPEPGAVLADRITELPGLTLTHKRADFVGDIQI